ncbi:MAG: ARMT1-like domain-containing protein [Methanolinea sp.]|nr:ARMT1-like domain-containing protein [Methanolinea sp.]
MKWDERCFSCLISRVSLECRLCHADPSLEDEIVDECARILEEQKAWPLPHPRIASALHRHAYRRLGTCDPFRELKERSTKEALEVCRRVRPRLKTWRDLVTASVIGNTFDFGVLSHTVAGDFSQYFEEEFAAGLFIDDTDRMLPLTDRVVYFTDNCGEIVFDRLLIEFLSRQGSKVTVAVRDEPILNDATRAEAEALHIGKFADLLTTTGCGCELGVRLDCLPKDLARAIDSCTLIISKGMANYESLSEYQGLPPVAHLMAVKCEPIANEVGVPRGKKIAMLRD